jgi:hypothetical protein
VIPVAQKNGQRFFFAGGLSKSQWYLVFTTGCDKLWMLGKTEDKEFSRHEVWYN